MIPVVQIVEELIQLQALLKPGSLGDLVVVGRVEGATKAPKHASYCQVILRVPIERSWVKDDGPRGVLCHVSSPEVSVEQGWDDVQIKEQIRDLQLRGGKAASAKRATHVGGVHVLARVAAHGHAWLRQGASYRHLTGRAHPPPIRHTSQCCTWLATSPWWGCRAWWAQGAAGLSHLQSRPELEGISVPRPLRQHVHLGLDALLGIECDPVLLPVIHLHKRQQRGKPSSEAHARAEGGPPKWEGLIA